MEATMPNRYQRLGLLGLLLSGALLLFYACGADLQDALLNGGDDGESGGAQFTIQGETTEAMRPGVMLPIDVTVTNPSGAPLLVTGLAVTVSHVTAPRATHRLPCTTDDFAVHDVPGDLGVTIAAHSTSTLKELDVPAGSWPHVGLINRHRNQDGCQRSSLTLDYSAAGTLQK